MKKLTKPQLTKAKAPEVLKDLRKLIMAHHPASCRALVAQRPANPHLAA